MAWRIPHRPHISAIVLDGGAENAGVENPGVEKAGVDSTGGKCRSGKCRSDNAWKAVRRYQ